MLSRPCQLKIYFSATPRNEGHFSDIREKIDFLKTLGSVLTEHAVSPTTVDFGHVRDAAICAHDEQLLDECDVFIADLSTPSTEGGFMTALAVQRKKLALCFFKVGQNPSEPIASCPGITTIFYRDLLDFQARVQEYLVPYAEVRSRLDLTSRRIFVMGPPGSGKGTVSEKIAHRTGAVHVNVENLLRALVATGTHPQIEKITACMNEGALVPADIVLPIVAEQALSANCQKFGFVLDGYPLSCADLLNLRTRGLTPDVVFYLDCSEKTAIDRQLRRCAARTFESAQKHVAVFREEVGEYLTVANEWYKDELAIRVNAEDASPDNVFTFIVETLANLFGPMEREQSFCILPPWRPTDVLSSRLHVRIDSNQANSVGVLHAIALEIGKRYKNAQGQIEIHPIHSLCLGPQSTRLPIYRELPSFRAIDAATKEAFITGRLGDGDTIFLETVLEVVRVYGGMVELEECVSEWTLARDGEVAEERNYKPLGVEMQAHAKFLPELCTNIPSFQLHLGFTIEKNSNAPSPALEQLTWECHAAGMQHGGWFALKHPDQQVYRSNEFSFCGIVEAKNKLMLQAQKLQQILREQGHSCAIMCSIEMVHGIWIMKK